MPEEPNSVMYWLAMHRDLPGVIVGFSLLGHVYVSEDDGDSWRKLDRDFGQIRSVAVTPTSAATAATTPGRLVHPGRLTGKVGSSPAAWSWSTAA